MIKDFSSQTIRKPTVLIVEPNPYHGEIIPGFVDYLQELGYDVHLLARSEILAENPFSRCPKNKMPKIFLGDAEALRNALKSEVTKKYDFLFFSTNVYWEVGVNYTSYIQYLGYVPSGKYGSLFVEHNLSYLDFDDASLFYQQNRVFTLLKYAFGGEASNMVNPHYFGDVSIKTSINPKIKILLLGSSSREQKNLDKLYGAIRRLPAAIQERIGIVAVGDKLSVPKELEPLITSTGRIDFPEYYKLVESSDYLLTIVDPDIPGQSKYLNGTTTGTVQISLGFGKPMIISEGQAGVYGFDNTNSIVLTGEDLAGALERAVLLSGESYAKIVNNLQKTADDIYDESLHTMKEAIRLLKERNRNDIEIVDNASLSLSLQAKELAAQEEAKTELSNKIVKLERQAEKLRIHINTQHVLLKSRRYRVLGYVADLVGKIRRLLKLS